MEYEDAQDLPLGSGFAVVHSIPGRLRLRLEPPQTAERLEAGAVAVRSVRGVRGARSSRGAWSLVVEYDPGVVTAADLLEVRVPPVEVRSGGLPDVVEAGTLIAAPAMRVWAVVSSLERLAPLAPEGMRILRDTAAKQWVAELRVHGRPVRKRLRLVKRVPGRRVLVLLENGNVRGWLSITLEPQDGHTYLRERLHYGGGSSNLLSWTVGRVVGRPALRAQLQAHLERIKAAVEQRRTPPRARPE